MKLKIFFYALFFTFSTTGFCQDMKNEPEVVNHVDLSKYAGLWYEIAKIPNRFQKHCVSGTTAQYKIRDDGKIEVINSCIESDGEKDIAEGVAKVVDESTNAKLEVSFVSIFGINLFWGDYWIIGLDDNYEYAVIGTPTRKYGWILARSPKLDELKLKEAYAVLTSQGYNVSEFEMTKQ